MHIHDKGDTKCSKRWWDIKHSHGLPRKSKLAGQKHQSCLSVVAPPTTIHSLRRDKSAIVKHFALRDQDTAFPWSRKHKGFISEALWVEPSLNTVVIDNSYAIRFWISRVWCKAYGQNLFHDSQENWGKPTKSKFGIVWLIMRRKFGYDHWLVSELSLRLRAECAQVLSDISATEFLSSSQEKCSMSTS